jgi:hypothetical protein
MKLARTAALASLVPLMAAGCGGGGYHGPLAPLCAPNPRTGEECKETSDGYYVPSSYYTTLQREEGTAGVPHVSGETPANPAERQPATAAPPEVRPNAEGEPSESP